MRKSKELLKAFELQMGLCGKGEKRWFWAAFVLLVLYVEFVVFARNAAAGHIKTMLQAVAAVPLCFLCFLVASRWKISGEARRAGDRTDLRGRIRFAAAVWGLTFFVFFLCLMANWPGGFSPDSISQYGQAVSGSYDNWHPVLQTWLFFRLPLLILRSPDGIVPLQLLWFSLAVTYLFCVLYANGCPEVFLACGWLYIAANPNTLFIMIFPWKDSALIIASTVMFAQLVQIYLTKGTWLKKWYNLASFSAFAFLTLEMRHNSVLLVIPVFVILICFFKSVRKRILLSASTVFLAHLLLYGPVFSLAHVQLPGNRTVETMGLPMTVLSDIYVQDREALSEDARAFMDSLAPQEAWGSYSLGNFNSIKLSGNLDGSLIEKAGYERLLQYTVDAAMKRPDLAWKAFSLLTRTVWGAKSGDGWRLGPYIHDNPYGIDWHGNGLLQYVFNIYSALVSVFITKYLFRYVGGVILVLLFLAVGNLGGGNLGRVFLVLAPMAYNFGTMLLLTGPDFRFFQFNFVIAVPLIYLMLRRKEASDDAVQE